MLIVLLSWVPRHLLDPYEVSKRWTNGSLRDLLIGQIAICTSGYLLLVAVRGLVRSVLGIDVQNVIVSSHLSMAGYSAGCAAPGMQERMTEAMQTLPGVTAAG